jgi:hypothetical protein
MQSAASSTEVSIRERSGLGEAVPRSDQHSASRQIMNTKPSTTATSNQSHMANPRKIEDARNLANYVPDV